jgi:hypothetical protein
VDSGKWCQWQRRIERFNERLRSVAEFCRTEGVSQASFYQWRKRLAAATAQEVGQASAAPGGFVAVRLVNSANVSVELPGGTRLQIPTSDAQTLRLAIETLAEADARRAGGVSC